MYRCLSLERYERYENRLKSSEDQCVFEKLSPCADKVGPYFCNKHRRLFKLKVRIVSYTNGNGETEYRYETVVISNTFFQLPLFQNKSAFISEKAINTFAVSVCNEFNFTETQYMTFKDILKRELTERDCVTVGWFDQPISGVVLRADPDNVIIKLPAFIRKLLSCTYASNVIVVNDNSAGKLRIPNTTFVQKNEDIYFVLTNPTTFSKLTDTANYSKNIEEIATPICIDGFYYIDRYGSNTTVVQHDKPLFREC